MRAAAPEGARPGSVALIGHSAWPQGKGWGGRIDSQGAIVRMNNCDWQDPYDYGKRYDYGVTSFHNHHGKITEREPAERLPRLAWFGYEWQEDRVPHEWRGLPCRQIISHNLRRAANKRDPDFRLTKGCIGACVIISHFRPRVLALVGCDMLIDGAHKPARDLNPTDYPFERSYKGKYHDYGAEAKLVKKFAAHFEVKLEDWR